jgi:hypothetical protein
MIRQVSQTPPVVIAGAGRLSDRSRLGCWLMRCGLSAGRFPCFTHLRRGRFCWRLTPLVVAATLLAFRVAGLYEVQRLRRFREELVGLLRGTTLAVLFVLALLFFTKQEYDSRLTLAYFRTAPVRPDAGGSPQRLGGDCEPYADGDSTPFRWSLSVPDALPGDLPGRWFRHRWTGTAAVWLCGRSAQPLD